MMVPADGFSSFRFSTACFPPQQRLARWNEVVGRRLSRRILSPPWLSEEPFNVDMTGHMLGAAGGDPERTADVSVMRLAVSTGGTARRTRELLADGNDDVILSIHRSGRRRVFQRGREANVQPGGGVLTSNAEASVIMMPTAARFVSIAVPRRIMLAMAPGLESAFMRSLPPGAGVLRLLAGYLDILDDDVVMKAPDARRAVATHIHDLCALVIGAAKDAAEIAEGRGLRAARLRAVKADILRHLGNARVSADTLALRQGVTPRYIHKLFEGEGTTLSRFVLGQRLVRVYHMLTDPRCANLSISAIAYKAGFGDLSTFNREFRRHFGATPSDMRAASRGEQRS